MIEQNKENVCNLHPITLNILTPVKIMYMFVLMSHLLNTYLTNILEGHWQFLS